MIIILLIGVYIVWYTFAPSKKERERKERAEAARIRAEVKWQKEQSQALLRKQREMEREQAKQRAEQERQRKEQERLAKEQDRQAAQLAKHEEEIDKLKFAVAKAQFDIEHYNQQLEDLNESLELATNTALFWRNKGDAKKEEQAKRRIVVLRNQIHTAETKIGKAQFTQKQAQNKLSA